MFKFVEHPSLVVLAATEGRIVRPAKPSAGAVGAYQVAPGETLDLSAIANESITLVKLGSRLVVLFEDRGYVVVDGLYLPDGSASQQVHVRLDGASEIDGAQFVAQFPISTDEQVLTAAGIGIGPRGAGGINLASAPPGSALQTLTALAPDEQGRLGTLFEPLPQGAPGFSTGTDAFGNPTPANPSLAAANANTNANANANADGPADTPATGDGGSNLPAPAAAGDVAAVTEAGIAPSGASFTGTPVATGSVLANDSGSGLSVTGVAAGALGSAAGGVATAINGTYGTLILAADGTYTYTLSNASAATDALAQGAVAQDVFTYTATDGQGRAVTAQLAVAVTGTNDAPLLDLDASTAGQDYHGSSQAEAARSTTLTEGFAGGVTVVQSDDALPSPVFQHSVSDPDGDLFTAVSLTLDPIATGAAGVIGLLPSFALPAGAVVSASAGHLAVAAPGLTAGEVRDLLAAIRYVNTESTFALDTSDRLIHITVTDAFGGQQQATAHIPVAANVTDTTGLDAFTGTRFDDIIHGLDGNNVIDAGLGHDRVTAGDGDNTILLGEGDNVALLGNGDNSVTAGSGADDITSGAGDDTVDAGDGDNLVDAGEGDNWISTGSGNDQINAGAGDDEIHAGAGEDVIDAGDGDNTIDAGTGRDWVQAGSGDDTILGGEGDDTILGGDGDDLIDGGAGDDLIMAGDGGDRILLGSGNDRITTGDGSDTLVVSAFDPASLPVITDFVSGDDQFVIDHLLAGAGLADGGADTGKLDTSRFAAGSSFSDAGQRFLFEAATGTLYYDADGSGAAAAVALAKLESGVVVANDIRLT
ncbi:VCBS domain-containing protein [Bosea thiooxidans]